MIWVKKYIILLLVCITVVLSVSAVGAGLFGDDVTVKEPSTHDCQP